MTQTQSITTLATRPSSGRKGWELQIFDPLGQELLVTYNSATNPGPIHEGFNSRRYPNNTCGPGSFLAIPKYMIGGDPRNIVKIAYDTGTKVVPVYFGYIAKAPDPRKGEVSKYELTSGKELLKNSPISPNFVWSSTVTVDAAYWVAELVERFAHPALKYREDAFIGTGVALPAPEVRGTNLYEALAAIIKAVPGLKENDWGVDPDGFVVMKQPGGSYTFTGEDAALKYGDRDGEQICTEATIRIANRVSEGAIVSAGYKPSLIAYSYTDPAHQIYRAPRLFELPKKEDGTPILEVLEYTPFSGFSHSGTEWTSSTSANVPTVATDGNVSTYAYNNGAVSCVMAVAASNSQYLTGAALIIDALAGSYGLTLMGVFENQPAGKSFTVKYDLNYLKGQGKVEARFIVPPPTEAILTAYFSLNVTSPTAANQVKVYELRGLEANTALLSQIAKSNIRLPARQVSQITFANTVTESGVLGGYLLETPVKTLIVTGEDGRPISCEVTEYNDTCTTVEGILTRAETGEPIRNPIVNTINDAINRALEAYS